jgi:hypothetical protein
VSVESPLPLELDQLPLAARTDMRDVRLVSVEAETHELPIETTHVQVAMDDLSYKVQDDTMSVKLVARVRYLVDEPDGETSENLDGEAAVDRTEAARIIVALRAELSFEGGAITSEQADEFMAGTMLFMLFPYARAAIQQIASDLRLPPTVLPFLRRGAITISAEAPSN